MGLAGVLQLAASELLTGILTVPGAEIRLHQGAVVGVNAEVGTQGIVGLRDAFMGPNGLFRLDASPAQEGTALGSTTMLIMDACRVADEWARLAPMRLAATDSLDLTDVAEPVRRAIEALDGERVVGEVLATAGVSAARVTDTLLTLLEARRLEEQGPPMPERVPGSTAPAPAVSTQASGSPPEVDEFELLEMGRRHLRERDFGRARTCFERALNIAPNNRLVRQNLRRFNEIEKNRRLRS